MPERYQILYRGERLDGVSDAQLRDGLARLFKADDAVLDRLLSGRPQLLKRDCDRQTAEHYRQMMAKVGAIAILQRVEQGQEEDSAIPQESSGDLSLAEPGTPVLRPEERGAPAAAAVEAPPLEVSAPGTQLADPPSAAPAPPDTSHLSVAEAGERLPGIPGPAPVSVPDTGLALAPPGTDFSDCHIPGAPPLELDLSSLSLAPEGLPLTEADKRERHAQAPPDTTHLSLLPEARED